MTEAPFGVGHVRFYKDALECLARRLALGFESFAQETVEAGAMIELRRRAAVRACRQILAYACDGLRGNGWFVH